MNKFVLTTAIIATLGFVASANAADMPARAPVYKAPIVAPYNWTGWYFGANAGGDWGRSDISETDITPLLVNIPAAQRQFSLRHSGVLGGLQGGYNWQLAPNWVAGVEADIAFSSDRGSTTSGFLFGGAFPGNFMADTHTDWLGTVRGRIGFLPVDRLLVYGTGGFAFGHVKANGSINNNFGAPLLLGAVPVCTNNSVCYLGSESKTATGWTLGGGLEYAVWDKVTVKLEYIYVNLGAQTITLQPSSTTTGGGAATFAFGDNVYNIVRAGVNLRF